MLSALLQKTNELREHAAHLDGDFVDIRSARPDLHDHDPGTYPATQVFGRAVRARPHAGITYDSVRHAGGTNRVAYRLNQIRDVLQRGHLRIVVPLSGKVHAAKIGTPF